MRENELQTTHDHKNIFGSHDVQLVKIIVHLHFPLLKNELVSSVLSVVNCPQMILDL